MPGALVFMFDERELRGLVLSRTADRSAMGSFVPAVTGIVGAC